MTTQTDRKTYTVTGWREGNYILDAIDDEGQKVEMIRTTIPGLRVIPGRFYVVWVDEISQWRDVRIGDPEMPTTESWDYDPPGPRIIWQNKWPKWRIVVWYDEEIVRRISLERSYTTDAMGNDAWTRADKIKEGDLYCFIEGIVESLEAHT